MEKKGETEMELGALREQIGNILYNDTACIKTIRNGTLINGSSVVTPISVGSIKNQAGQDVIVPNGIYGNGLIKVISLSLDNISVTSNTAEIDLQVTFEKSSRAISGYKRSVKTFPLSVELNSSGRSVSCNSDIGSATTTAKRQICRKLGGLYNPAQKKCQSPMAKKCATGLVQSFDTTGNPVCITPQATPGHPPGKSCFLISLYEGNYAFKPLSDSVLTDSTKLNKWRHTYKGRSAKAIALGGNHSCAILDDDTLKCWGDNTYGQVGDGSTTMRKIPTLINLPNGRKPKTIVMGKNHSCVILDNNALRCWGDNQHAQLGDGTKINRKTSTYINFGGGRTVKTVALGEGHTCAVLDDNTTRCWGRNHYGQLGRGFRSDAPTTNPTEINLGTSYAKQLALGDNHSCALLNDDTLKCWGHGSNGQLGNGSRHNQYSPVTITVGTNRHATHIESGTHHVCALRDDNSVTCWGRNDLSQLGATIAQDYDTAGDVVVNLGSGLTVEDISLGRSYSCAVMSDNTLKCWGYIMGQTISPYFYALYNNNALRPPTAISLGGATPQKVAVGKQHVCVIQDDNFLKCWGENSKAQIGVNRSGGTIPTPSEVDLGDSVPSSKYFNLASCPTGYSSHFFNPMSSTVPVPSIPSTNPASTVGGVESAFMEHYCCK